MGIECQRGIPWKSVSVIKLGRLGCSGPFVYLAISGLIHTYPRSRWSHTSSNSIICYRCNTIADCKDASDEANCTTGVTTLGPTKQPTNSPTNQPTDKQPTNLPTKQPTQDPTDQPTNSPTKQPTQVCTDLQWKCADGPCIATAYLCNTIADCKDASDEANCTTAINNPSKQPTQALLSDAKVSVAGLPFLYGVLMLF